jgi:hypothetical protein
MPNYRRIKTQGATFFFTVSCARRGDNRVLVDHIDLLRDRIRKAKQAHPFRIDVFIGIRSSTAMCSGSPIGLVRAFIGMCSRKFCRGTGHGTKRTWTRGNELPA